jgi:hypothetical protein
MGPVNGYRQTSANNKQRKADLAMSVDWSAIGSIGTTVAVLVAAWQVRKGTQQAQTNFEDQLSREYRDLARCIPVSAFLDAEMQEAEFKDAFPVLYRYLDLSNEQAFLRKNGRVRLSTWGNWCDGIHSTLKLHAFDKAWSLVKEKRPSSHFEELRKLTGPKYDPRSQVTRWDRAKQWLGLGR